MREYGFDGYRLSVLRRQLLSPQRELLDLPARAFDALVFLIEHRHEDVGKEQLMKAVWPDTIVEENNLNQAVFTLRRALGDSAREARYILTLPGRGYRFIAEVSELSDAKPRTLAKPIVLSAIGLIVVATLAWVFWPQHDHARGVPTSVAILPFKALLPEQSDPALELGMTNSLITQISGLSGVKVSSLSSVRSYAAPDQDPLAAGKSLGVESVLESSILKQEERIRVTARLLRVSDGKSLWAGQFDQAASDILGVQDSIAQRVAQTLASHLAPGGGKVRGSRSTDNPEAYELYTKGFYNQQRRDIDGLPAAAEAYEAAVTLDPDYVEAWGGLSRVLALQGVSGTRPPMSVFPRAKEAALKAVELGPESAEAHAALGHVLAIYERKFKLAAEQYAIAKRLNPDVPEFYLLSSMNEAFLGHVDESLVEARRALEIEPASPVLRANLGMLLYFARSYDDAEAQLRRVIALQPRFDLARNFLGRTLLAKGDLAGALEQFSARINPTPGSFADPGRTFAISGRTQEALLEIDKLRAIGAQGFAVNYEIATIYAALGEKQLGCESLEGATRDGTGFIGMLQIDPAVDPLRTEPCYADVSHEIYADPRR